MAAWRITVHGATTDWGRLAHWWSEASSFTRCTRFCAYDDGPEKKLATGWVMAGPAVPDCPLCLR